MLRIKHWLPKNLLIPTNSQWKEIWSAPTFNTKAKTKGTLKDKIWIAIFATILIKLLPNENCNFFQKLTCKINSMMVEYLASYCLSMIFQHLHMMEAVDSESQYTVGLVVHSLNIASYLKNFNFFYYYYFHYYSLYLINLNNNT